MLTKRLLVPVFLLCAATARADVPGVYAITGGTVHPVSGPEIAGGTVVIRDGLIEAVGASVAVPADAVVIDAKGMHVYPGLIDGQTSLGFATPSATPRRRGAGAAARTPAPEPAAETTPASMAARDAKISDDDLDARRSTGVTTIVTAPAGGIFNGQSVLLNLAGGSPDARIIRSPAAEQISFTPRAFQVYPDSLMGVISYIRQTFLDSQQYGAARAIYDRAPAGLQRPADSPPAEALGGALRRDVPTVFIADSEAMMRRAQKIATEFNLRIVFSGARQSYRLADDLKSWNAPVLVSVKWPAAPADKEDREEQPLRVIRDRALAPTSPSVLARSGVMFALVSGAGKAGDFLPGIRKAIDNGLSDDDALRAVTLTPARIFGVERQLGSLERGKIANVVVSDKPIFAKESKVKQLFVDGREVRLPAEDEKKGTGSGAAAEGGTSPIDGTWSLNVRTPQGEVALQVTLRAEDGKLTGNYSGDRGSGDIRNGKFDGTTAAFSIAITGASNQDSGDWAFSGTLKDGHLDGSVTTNLGTFPFTGSKSTGSKS
jgi:imidazolonepropionase-like amidohydrolase